ncbi:hypothetical protein OQA88_8866 [Cercophora sp. LCS_1]
MDQRWRTEFLELVSAYRAAYNGGDRVRARTPEANRQGGAVAAVGADARESIKLRRAHKPGNSAVAGSASSAPAAPMPLAPASSAPVVAPSAALSLESVLLVGSPATEPAFGPPGHPADWSRLTGDESLLEGDYQARLRHWFPNPYLEDPLL